MRQLATCILISTTALACANRPGPLCLGSVTTYVEGAKTRGIEGATETRAGVSFEWDMSGQACEGDTVEDADGTGPARHPRVKFTHKKRPGNSGSWRARSGL